MAMSNSDSSEVAARPKIPMTPQPAVAPSIPPGLMELLQGLRPKEKEKERGREEPGADIVVPLVRALIDQLNFLQHQVDYWQKVVVKLEDELESREEADRASS